MMRRFREGSSKIDRRSLPWRRVNREMAVDKNRTFFHSTKPKALPFHRLGSGDIDIHADAIVVNRQENEAIFLCDSNTDVSGVRVTNRVRNCFLSNPKTDDLNF